MEYHCTRDIIHVMKFLGHRDIRNTMRYIDIVNHVFKYKADEYTTRAATNVKGARALLEAGFEHVMNRDGVMIFRKRK